VASGSWRPVARSPWTAQNPLVLHWPQFRLAAHRRPRCLSGAEPAARCTQISKPCHNRPRLAHPAATTTATAPPRVGRDTSIWAVHLPDCT
jgi:hypothetical protein